MLINSGSVQKVKELIARYNFDFPVAVSQGTGISESYNSRMVPTLFLIDEEGMITRKFVGYKDAIALGSALSDFLGADSVAVITSGDPINNLPVTL